MTSSARQSETNLDQELLLDVVRSLVSELGHQAALASVRLEAHLERELGLGSLERVELLLRLEMAFGIRLDDEVLANAETVQDLLGALGAASLTPGNRAADSNAKVESPTLIAQSSSIGLAEGITTAETFQDVLRLRGRTINDAGPSQAALRRHLIFYEDDGEDKSLTFAELLEGGERVAAELMKRGVRRGDRVALMLPTSRDFFLTFAGTLLAGGTPVPIYPPFRADRIAEYAERQSAILANAGAKILVTFREAASVARLLRPRVPSLEDVVTSEALLASREIYTPGPHIRTRADDLALLQYTSGSTGNPKGVMLTHANLLANVRAIGEALALRSDDVGVSWLPLYHDMGLIGAWLMPLYFGLPVVILSPLAFLSRPSRWLQAFHRYRGTVGAAPNFAYEVAAAKIPDEEIRNVDLSSWRAALNGAEPVLPTTLERFAKRFADFGFHRESLLPVYGLAESSLAVAIPAVGHKLKVDHLRRQDFARDGRAVPVSIDESSSDPVRVDPDVISFVSVGKPVPRHEVRIATENGDEAEERVEGHLWFRGPSVTRGYYQNESATAALFPQGAAAGWVNSGDRAYRAEGEIFITGRVKDIIIHAGHNIYPHEMEDAVAQVAGVRKGCVVAFGAADPKLGTERLIIVAESREREPAPKALIVQAIVSKVTESMGIPPDIVKIVRPNVIPKTSSGKLRRDETKSRFLSGQLDSTSPPAWLQIARLAIASGVGRIRAAVRRALAVAYGCYAICVFCAVLLPAWALLLVSRSRKTSAFITTAALRTFVKIAGWNIRVTGLENIRNAEPCMYVANHTSYADILVVMAALGVNYHFVAKDEVRSMPFVRTFVRKLGHFTFKREDPRARLHQALEIEQTLRRGESVFVFPEGTFTAQPGVRPFHLGAFKAAAAARRPIVPVALSGTRRALRDGTWLPRRAQIRVTVCSPIFLEMSTSNWKEIVRVRDSARELIAHFAGEPLL